MSHGSMQDCRHSHALAKMMAANPMPLPHVDRTNANKPVLLLDLDLVPPPHLLSTLLHFSVPILATPSPPPCTAITPQPTAPPSPDAPAPPPLPANVAIAHAPGFEKYVDVAAGKLAHEAG